MNIWDIILPIILIVLIAAFLITFIICKKKKQKLEQLLISKQVNALFSVDHKASH